MYIAFVMDDASNKMTIVVTRLPARARGEDVTAQSDLRESADVLCFLSCHGVPSGLARERTLDRERVCKRSFFRLMKIFHNKRAVRRPEDASIASSRVSAEEKERNTKKPSPSSDVARSDLRRLDHLGPRDDVYVAVRPLLLEVHEPVRLEH